MATARRILHLAKERALFGFPVLAQQMIVTAQETVELALHPSAVYSSQERTDLIFVRQFLHHQARSLQQKICRYYQQSLDRAIQTVYNDLRQGMRQRTVDSLSLVDDETVHRQIDLERITVQFREADTENLGLINIMIAQLYGQSEVLERENPFRPFLLARALYQSINEIVTDISAAKIMIQYLASAMVDHLPQFYGEIRAAFEARGIRARLVAKPMKLNRADRASLQARAAAIGLPSNWTGTLEEETSPIKPSVTLSRPLSPEVKSLGVENARLIPSLQRLLGWAETTVTAHQPQHFNEPEGFAQSLVRNPDALQDLIWNLFHAEATLDDYTASSQTNAPLPTPISEGLMQALNQYQASLASGEVLYGLQPEQNLLFAFREQMNAIQATEREHMIIDVVAVLFEFILEDRHIPVEVRSQVGRLQIPFVKLAMIDRTLLQDNKHAARQLLNRIGSISSGLDTHRADGQLLVAEIKRIIEGLLKNFENDPAVFSTALQGLEEFLKNSWQSSTNTLNSAIEEAEKISVLLINTTISLRDLLTPLNADKRISDFILQVWARVLVRAYWLENKEILQEEGRVPTENTVSREYQDTMADLVWSAQPKATQEEKNALLKMLTGIVKRVKAGLHLIQLPDQERQYALDRLVEIHTERFSVSPVDMNGKILSLEQLRQHFSRFQFVRDEVQLLPEQDWALESNVVEEVFDERGVEANVVVNAGNSGIFDSDQQLLDMLRLGILIERVDGEHIRRARLTWISARKSLYLFAQENNSAPIVYSPVSLVAALHEGTVRFVEYAPIFDRAVDALLLSAEAAEARLQKPAH